ncbi:MAG: AAA family ATPase, partial [Myxococcales bacterium]|nr:AAA family ATPase [Myxococcales bacterium]
MDLDHAISPYLSRLQKRMLAEPSASQWSPSATALNGAFLFVDIAGFTKLTERFSKVGPRGAEDLSRALESYFGIFNDVVLSHGGDIIGYAGPAGLAFWDQRDYGTLDVALTLACQCGLRLQSTLEATPFAQDVVLRQRVAVDGGSMVNFDVGDVEERCMTLLAGPAVLRAGHAQSLAALGDVVVHDEVWSQISSAFKSVSMGGNLRKLLSVESPRPLPAHRPDHVAPTNLASRYLHRVVLTRLGVGQRDFIAEFRTLTVLFINLPLVDADVRMLTKLQQAVVGIQGVLAEYEGTLHRAMIDDKGTSLVAPFGLPSFAHEDDSVRAIEAAIRMGEVLKSSDLEPRIGVATGRLFCGDHGSAARRQYSLVGPTINRAARLMQACDGSHGLLLDGATLQSLGGRFPCELVAEIKLKGTEYETRIYTPVGRLRRAKAMTATTLIGRLDERERLTRCLDRLGEGVSGVVVIEGPPGIGKSALVAWARQQAEAREIMICEGAADSMNRQTTLYSFRGLFAQVLGVAADGPLTAPPSRLSSLLGDDSALREFLPLLTMLLPLGIPENQMTAQMTAENRAGNLRRLLLRILEVHTAGRPCVLLLEDAHWMDSATWALAHAIIEEVEGVLLVVTTRPLAAPTEQYGLWQEMPEATFIQLEALDRECTIELSKSWLGTGQLSPEIETLVFEKSEGNPFYCEEILSSLRDLGMIEDRGTNSPGAKSVKNFELPDSLEGLIVSRIDRLEQAPQLVLKIASIIGRKFDASLLRSIFPLEG